MSGHSEKDLLPVARGELLRNLSEARKGVWLASPYLSLAAAKKVRKAASRPELSERRLLTALEPRSVESGVLSPKALRLLKEGGFEIRTAPNLHAKVSLVDSRWGLVGSGNLTNAGMGGEDDPNLELGVVLSAPQRSSARKIFDSWWTKSKPVSMDLISEYEKIPRRPFKKSWPEPAGSPIPVPDEDNIEDLLEQDRLGLTSRSYWLNANYHQPDNEGWWRRGWISDWRRASYAVGDLIVIYLAAKDNGPARCPAIVRVNAPCRFDREFVKKERDLEAARKYPFVTDTKCLHDVLPVDDGIPLASFKANAQSLEGGYCHISQRQFEEAFAAMCS